MKYLLLGAIAGDVCGSTYEYSYGRIKDITKVNLFRPDSTFTDDTIATIAVADHLMSGKSIEERFEYWFKKYSAKGCAKMFKDWVYSENKKPYGSWGNGAAMRISPVGFMETYHQEVINHITNCTHNHIDSIDAATAVAGLINISYYDNTEKNDHRDLISGIYPQFENLSWTLDSIRPDYQFEVSCAKSVPESILCFLESTNFEHCLKLAISMGGDADTMACIAGSIAYPFYKEMSKELEEFVIDKLDDDIFDIVCKFDEFIKYGR